MAQFAGRKGDLTWGIYDYPVTRTQKATLDGLLHVINGLPRAYFTEADLPYSVFYSQTPSSGDVVIGLNGQSVSVHRNGRLTRN